MKDINEVLPLLETILEGLGKHFGDKFEFVLHDYKNGFRSSIISIVNGEITGRKVGDSGTKIGLELTKPKQTTEDGRYHYSSQTKDGKMLTSSTIYLRDDDGVIIGSLCINFDCSEMVLARNFMDSFLCDKPSTEDTIVYENVEDLINELLMESVEKIGIPVSQMSRENKIEVIQFLQDRGALGIKGGVNKIAKFLGITRYTVYNYINEIKQ